MEAVERSHSWSYVARRGGLIAFLAAQKERAGNST
jgi:hypothetical protein